MADITLEKLQADPLYQSVSAADKQRLEQHFMTKAFNALSNDIDYRYGNEDDKHKAHSSFLEQFPQGQQLVGEEENKNNTFLENLTKRIVHSGEMAINSMRNVDDIVTGNVDPDTKTRFNKNAHEYNYVPPEEKEIQSRVIALSKQWDASDTLVKKMLTIGSSLSTIVESIATNLKGSTYFAGSSLLFQGPGLVAGMLGKMLAGAAVSSGVGAAAAPLIIAGSRMLGQIPTEAGAYFEQLVNEELQKRNLPITEKSYGIVLDDEAFLDRVRAKSLLKGLGTSAVDTLFAFKTGQMASLPARPGLMGKVNKTAKIFGTEFASEPLGEMGGTLLAGEGIDPGEAAGEAIGGFMAGPIMAPINAATFATKGVAKGTAQQIKQAGNPEASPEGASKESLLKSALKAAKRPFTEKTPEEVQRAEAKATNKAEENVLKNQAKSPAQYDYKQKVEKAAETGKVNFEVDPILAAEAIAVANRKEDVPEDVKVENKEKSRNALDAMYQKSDALMAEITQIYEGQEGALTGKEHDRINSLKAQLKPLNKIIDIMAPLVESTDTTHKALTEEETTATIDSVKAALKADDARSFGQSILTLLGSKQSDRPRLDDTLGTPAEGSATEEVYGKAMAMQKAIDEMKSTSEVNQDILNGGKGYKGISEYIHDINVGLKNNNMGLVTRQIISLKEFAERHTQKAEIFTRAMEAGEVVESDKTAMAVFEASRGSTYDFSVKNKVMGMVQAIQSEAVALNEAVSLVTTLANMPTAPVEVKPTETPVADNVPIDLSEGTDEVDLSVENEVVDFLDDISVPDLKKTKKADYVDSDGVAIKYFNKAENRGVLAHTNGKEISLQEDITPEEFTSYFAGKQASHTSAQKAEVLKAFGLTEASLKKLFTTTEAIEAFIIAHEKSHILHEDKKVYGQSSEEQKLAIEIRATEEAFQAIGLTELKAKENVAASVPKKNKKVTSNPKIEKYTQSVATNPLIKEARNAVRAALLQMDFKFIDQADSPDVLEIERIASKILRGLSNDDAEFLDDAAKALSYALYHELGLPERSQASREWLEESLRSWLETGQEPRVNKKIWVKILQRLQQLLSFFSSSEFKQIDKKLADTIHKLKTGHNFSFSPKPGFHKLNFQQEMNNNPLAVEVLLGLSKSKLDFRLTGSVAYADQIPVYRKTGKPLHDVDILLAEEDIPAALEALETYFGTTATILYDFTPGGRKRVLGIALVPDGHTIKNLHKGFKPRAKGGAIPYRNYEVFDANDQKVGSYSYVANEKEIFEGVAGVIIDLMGSEPKKTIKQSFQVKDVTHTINVATYVTEFAAKLGMLRYKDINDYLGVVPPSTKESTNVLLPQSEQSISEDQTKEETPVLQEAVTKDGDSTVSTRTDTEGTTGESTTKADQTTGEEAEEHISVPEEDVRQSLVEPDAEDTVNPIRKHLLINKKMAGLLQRVGNTLTQFPVSLIESLGVFTEKDPKTDAAEAVIGALNKFSDKFHKHFSQVFYVEKISQDITWDTFIRIINGLALKDVPHADKQILLKQIKARRSFFTKPKGAASTNREMLDVLQAHKAEFKAKPFNALVKRMERRIEANNDYRHLDPIKYFATTATGELPTYVVNALMAATFEWLGTQSNKTMWNDDDSIRKILEIGKEDTVRHEARQLLNTLGTSQAFLVQALGKSAYQLLGYSTKDSVDADFQSRLEASLGMQAIAVLENTGILTSTDVFLGSKKPKEGEVQDLSQVTTGLVGLANFNQDPESRSIDLVRNHFLVTPEKTKEFLKDDKGKFVLNEQGKKIYAHQQEAVMPFYRLLLDSDSEVPAPDKQLSEDYLLPYRAAPRIWSLIFKGEPTKREYSWYRLKEKTVVFLKGTPFKAAKDQLAKLTNHENKPRVMSPRAMSLYLLLGENNLRLIQGWTDPKSVHLEHRKGAIGNNLGILRSNQAVEAFLNDAEKHGGYLSEFFVPEEFWRHGRMGEVGSIQMQGDKNHRALFNFAAWNKTIDLTDPAFDTWFMEAVALNLDQETVKKNGMDGAIANAIEVLESEKVAAAVKTIQEVIAEFGSFDAFERGELLNQQGQYTAEMKIITEGVVATKMGLRGMKALLEYARYLTAKADPIEAKQFKTDLTTEIDGVSNGIAIGMVQLLSKGFNLGAIMAAWQNAGMFFHEKDSEEGLAKYLGKGEKYDAYRATGFQWSNELTWIEKELVDQKDGHALRKLSALKSIFGELRDRETGKLSSEARKLSKDPTMTTVFGQGDTSRNKALAASFVDKIYVRIEEAIKAEDVEALKLLNQQVFDATGSYLWGRKSISAVETMDKETLLDTRLSYKAQKQLFWNVKDTYGEALKLAIKTNYGFLQESYKALNDGISYSAAMYNTIRTLRLEALNQAIEKKEGQRRKLTKKEMASVDNDLLDMFPFIKTIFEEKMALTPESRIKQRGTDAVEQKYKSGQKVKRAYGYLTGGAANPGVRSTILSIHNAESVIAITMMDVIDALNNHDGFTVAVGDGPKASKTANKSFYDTMKNHDIGMALLQGMQAIEQQYLKEVNALIAGDNMIDSKQIRTQLLKELTANKLNSVLQQKDGSWPTLKLGDEKRILDKVGPAMQETAVNAKRYKDRLLKAVFAVEQYSYPGGMYKTGNSQKSITIDSEKYLFKNITVKNEKNMRKQDVAAVKLVRYIRKKLAERDAALGSSPNSTVIIDNLEDYAKQQQISSLNALQVYDRIKNNSSVSIVSTHDSYLQGLLKSIVNKMMQPVDLYMKTNPNKETAGYYDPETQSIYISEQNEIVGPLESGALHQGIRMSTGEVYAHELTHNILHFGLSNDIAMRKKVKALFTLVYKKLEDSGEGYKVFLNDPTIDVTDIAHAYEVEAAKERYDYIFNNTDPVQVTEVDPATGIKRTVTYSPYLDEFASLGLTNENFLRYLQGVELTGTAYSRGSWGDVIGANVQETLSNIFQRILDFFYSKFNSSSTRKDVAGELRRLAVILSKQDTKRKSAMYEAAQAAESKYSKLGDYANDYIKKAVKALPIVSTATKIKKNIDLVYDSDTPIGQFLREQVFAFRRLDQNIIKSVASEMAGRTDRLDWIHQLLSYRKIYLDAAKEDATEAHIKALNSRFKKSLTDPDKTSITESGLKTDLVTLLNAYGVDELKTLMGSSAAIETKIQDIVKKIKSNKALRPYVDYYVNASESMGHFMIHSRAAQNEHPWQNALIIAELKNTPAQGKLAHADIVVAEKLVDQLGSLYALKHTAATHKAAMHRLLTEETDAIVNVLKIHEVLKADALEGSFHGNKHKFMKGYTKQILNSRIGFTYGTLADETEFRKAGYKRHAKPIARDKTDPIRKTDIYIYTSKTGRVNDLLSGVFSFTGNVGKGTTSAKIARQMDLTLVQGRVNNQKILREKKVVLQNMMKPGFKPNRGYDNTMIAQVDEAGKVTQYRYMMAETTKKDHLEQITEFDKILGSMAGQVIDKVRTPEINDRLIDGLKDMYDKEYVSNPGSFVEISPYTNITRHKEIYYMMPDSAREKIKQRWGTDKMYVAKDLVDLAFGYRNYSIVDAYTKDAEDMARIEKMIVGVTTKLFKEKAVHYMNVLESSAIELTQIAKSNIIVKSLYVTMGNFGSNMVYLKAKGVPISTIIKMGGEAMIMGNKYQMDSKKLNQLNIQMKVLKKSNASPAEKKRLQAEIFRMEDTLSRNPTKLTIESGLLPSLVDDVETVTGGRNFPTAFEKQAGKLADKLGPVVGNVGKVLLLTEDTTAFKVLNNAVKMTDFVGRHVLYHHYLKEGMAHEKAIASVTDEFVNFNVPTHRMIEYGNMIGLLWFTKFGTRILKVIKDAAVEKPFHFFMALLMSNSLGLDNIANSTPGVKDMTRMISDPLTVFLDTMDKPITVNVLSSSF